MQMKRFLLCLIVFSSSACIGATREYALGLVDYFSKYEAFTSERTKRYDAVVRSLMTDLRALGLTPRWLDPDAFMPGGERECNRFKRIMIPYYASSWSLEHYAGMAESMGVSGYGPIEDPDEIAPALTAAWEDVQSGTPALVDVVCQPR